MDQLPDRTAVVSLLREEALKIALIVATGFVGSAVLKENLQRRHEVTAIREHLDRIGREQPDNAAMQIKALASDIAPFSPEDDVNIRPGTVALWLAEQ